MSNAIEIKNLKKYFGKNHAVDDINLSIERGEIFGFLGPNGAGKTTTMRAIMDFITPTSGTITIDGLDSKKDSVEIKRKIGYLPSDSYFYGGWTGREHMDFVRGFYGIKTNPTELIKKLAFDSRKKVKSLSTGNKQKLGIILALMGNPDILVLDEPTRGLDPILQNDIYEILNDYKKAGKTAFVSSHNLPEVEKICDRIAIIKSGKIIKTTTIQEIKQLKIHFVTVVFPKKIRGDQIESDDCEIIRKISDGYIVKVKGEIGPFLKRIAPYEIKDIEVAHANLEEIFLEYYKK